MPTHQASLDKGALLKELLNQLEAENMKIAVLIFRQGAVTDVISGRKDCIIGQASN